VPTPVDDGDAHTLVLVVEDDANAARMLAQLLREDGYAVEIISSGEAALSRLARPPSPGVIIVDFRLPRIDGLAVARMSRTLAPSARVIMVTSYPEVVEARLEAENADAILVPKPLAYEELTKHMAPAIPARRGA
jgi:DNA-binding response OmpR family regulator